MGTIRRLPCGTLAAAALLVASAAPAPGDMIEPHTPGPRAYVPKPVKNSPAPASSPAPAPAPAPDPGGPSGSSQEPSSKGPAPKPADDPSKSRWDGCDRHCLEGQMDAVDEEIDDLWARITSRGEVTDAERERFEALKRTHRDLNARIQKATLDEWNRQHSVPEEPKPPQSEAPSSPADEGWNPITDILGPLLSGQRRSAPASSDSGQQSNGEGSAGDFIGSVLDLLFGDDPSGGRPHKIEDPVYAPE